MSTSWRGTPKAPVLLGAVVRQVRRDLAGFRLETPHDELLTALLPDGLTLGRGSTTLIHHLADLPEPAPLTGWLDLARPRLGRRPRRGARSGVGPGASPRTLAAGGHRSRARHARGGRAGARARRCDRAVGPEEEGWVLARDIQREFGGRRLNVEVPYQDADGAGRTVRGQPRRRTRRQTDDQRGVPQWAAQGDGNSGSVSGRPARSPGSARCDGRRRRLRR